MANLLPAILTPTAFEVVTLPSGATVTLPKAAPTFPAWAGPPVRNDYGGKPVLDFGGRPAFAELVVLWSLVTAGWKGAWIDNYRRRIRSGYWNDSPDVTLPARLDSKLRDIRLKAGCRGGTFDVIAWRDGYVLFAEAKRRGKDRIRDTQKKWLDAALGVGIRKSQLLVVEWDLAP